MATNSMKQFNQIAQIHDKILASNNLSELLDDNHFMTELRESISKISATTIKGYAGAKKTLQNKFANGDFTDFDDGMKRKGYEKKVSSLKFFLRQGLADLADPFRNNDTANTKLVLDELTQTIQLIRVVQQHKPRVFSRKGGEGQKLRKAKDEWQNVFIDQVLNSRSKYKIPALVQYITGCRPAELKKQILVTIVENQLRFRIKGVKTDGTKGQDKRDLYFDIDMTNLAIAEVYNQVKTHELVFQNGHVTEGLVISENANAHSGFAFACYDSYKDFVSRCGEHLIPGQRLNPYFLRHDFASRLKTTIAKGRKKSELTDAEIQSISACMGHASTKTQDYYGRFNHRTGGGLCPDVTKTKTSQPVRVSGNKKPMKKAEGKAHLRRRMP